MGRRRGATLERGVPSFQASLTRRGARGDDDPWVETHGYHRRGRYATDGARAAMDLGWLGAGPLALGAREGAAPQGLRVGGAATGRLPGAC